MKHIFVLLLLGLLGFASAQAVEPDEMLADPALERRAREISKILRCLVCQNQSIDDSNADLARDLRLLVRRRLVAGDTDDEAVQYIVDRYGEFVLLRPPFRPSTYVLWLGPFAMLLAAGAGLFVFYRRRRAQLQRARPAPLTDDEAARLKELLEGDEPP